MQLELDIQLRYEQVRSSPNAVRTSKRFRVNYVGVRLSSYRRARERNMLYRYRMRSR